MNARWWLLPEYVTCSCVCSLQAVKLSSTVYQNRACYKTLLPTPMPCTLQMLASALDSKQDVTPDSDVTLQGHALIDLSKAAAAITAPSPSCVPPALLLLSARGR